MHKNIDPKDFEGKTIRKLEADAINIIRFHFTDGTSIAIEVEGFGGGLTGMVSCEACAKQLGDTVTQEDDDDLEWEEDGSGFKSIAVPKRSRS